MSKVIEHILAYDYWTDLNSDSIQCPECKIKYKKDNKKYRCVKSITIVHFKSGGHSISIDCHGGGDGFGTYVLNDYEVVA
jgi:hypothetical protein